MSPGTEQPTSANHHGNIKGAAAKRMTKKSGKNNNEDGKAGAEVAVKVSVKHVFGCSPLENTDGMQTFAASSDDKENNDRLVNCS